MVAKTTKGTQNTKHMTISVDLHDKLTKIIDEKRKPGKKRMSLNDAIALCEGCYREKAAKGEVE